MKEEKTMLMFDILESMCDSIFAKFPGNPIYIRSIPQGFCRPSFYVRMAGFNDQDLNNGIMMRQIAYDIVYFAPKDEDGQIDTVSQLASYAIMAQVFQHQGLDVMGRHIKITSVDGGPREAEVYLTVNFEYAYAPEKIPSTPELYELMQNLEFKYQIH